MCTPCVDYAVCLGGKKISVNAGYWRDSLSRTNILQCYSSSACLGGYYEDQQYPVMCKTGYSGILCNNCVLD